MAHERQHQSLLELITQNVRSILADVLLNKLEFGVGGLRSDGRTTFL